MRHVGIVLFVAFAALISCKSKKDVASAQPAEDPKPTWVQSRPTAAGYYIGIGVSSKQFAANDYAQVAKRNALNDLASEISVKIDANSILYQLESNHGFQEDFRATTKLSTTQELEGYEVVDAWETDKDYWVFYRLSKAKYQEQKQQAIDQAVDRSLGYYKAGRAFEGQGDVAGALRQYFKALESVRSFLGEPLQTSVENQEVFYGNHINQRIEAVSSTLQLAAKKAKVFSVTGRAISDSELSVTATKSGNPIAALPISFKPKGDAFSVSRSTANTTSTGVASTSIDNAPEMGTHSLVVAVDYGALVQTEDAVLQAYLNTLDDHATEITLVVESPKILVKATEYNLGVRASRSQLGQAFSAGAVDNKIQTTTSVNDADYTCVIEARTEKNTVSNSLYISVLNGELTLKAADGSEVYRHVFTNVKGVGLNYKQAGEKAIEAAMVTIREDVVPELRRKLKG